MKHSKDKNTSETSRIVFVILFLVLLAYFAPGTSKETETSDEIQTPTVITKDKQLDWVMYVKDEVRMRLKDPKSAKFRDTYFSSSFRGIPMVCGEVNSKNSFGGFTGYQKFVGSAENLILLEEQADDFYNVWNKVCK